MSHKVWMVSAVLLGALACDDLDPPDDGPAVSPGPVSTVDGGGDGGKPSGDRTLLVDASKQDAWTYVDLETAQAGSDPAQLPGWDFAAQRMNIKLNGGVSGTADVQASVVQGTPYASLTSAPPSGWDSDREDGSDSDQMADFLLSVGATGWYDYAGAPSHKLSPRPFVYAVKSSEGTYYKLAILNYYNDAGSAGYLTVQWAKIAGPSGPTSGRDAGIVDETTSASKPATDGGVSREN